MKRKRKRITKLQKTIKDLVPVIFALGIVETGLKIAGNSLLEGYGEEIRKRLLELRLMGVIEIEKRDKNKKTIIEYRSLRGIKKYIKNFLKRNPKWKSEYEYYGEIKTGRIILTRLYRYYSRKSKYDEENYCSECGRCYDDYD